MCDLIFCVVVFFIFLFLLTCFLCILQWRKSVTHALLRFKLIYCMCFYWNNQEVLYVLYVCYLLRGSINISRHYILLNSLRWLIMLTFFRRFNLYIYIYIYCFRERNCSLLISSDDYKAAYLICCEPMGGLWERFYSKNVKRNEVNKLKKRTYTCLLKPLALMVSEALGRWCLKAE